MSAQGNMFAGQEPQPWAGDPQARPQEISIEALLQCAGRELSYRRRVYPRLVGEDRMSPQKMAYEIACMERIVDILDEMNGRLL